MKPLEMPQQHLNHLNNRSKPPQQVVEIDFSTLKGFVKKGDSNAIMTPSEDSSVTAHEDETLCNNSSILWSNLNLLDTSTNSRSPPLIEELIRRNVAMIEALIINIMNWRDRQGKKKKSTTSHWHYNNSESINELPELAKLELELYVRTIASHYNKVLYHNFEHASHVTACVNQLMMMCHDGTSYSPSLGPPELASLSSSMTTTSSALNTPRFENFTISNPVVHLSMVISALVHDVEHKGIGNKQLVDENDPLALKYKGKSVAENNSFDFSTDLFQEDEFQNLRKCIFGESDDGQSDRDIESNKSLFYQISHDVVLSTDISCPTRLAKGKSKWKKAFEQESDHDLILSCGPQPYEFKCEISFPSTIKNPPITGGSSERRVSFGPTEFIADPFPDQTKLPRPVRIRDFSWMSNLKLSGSTAIKCPFCGTCTSRDDAFQCISYTLLSSTLEQILQAADVGHTMQSWPVFVKWNEKLYCELWVANSQGRGPDCDGQWFSGQLSFFDNYIFPLAERLQQCGVFGAVGTIFYENASLNRERWVIEGNDLCRKMHANAMKMFGASHE